MFWLGFVLLSLGAFLLGCTNPWKFFEASEGQFFDWTEIFWYLQWSGFWLVTASLLIFGGLAWKAPATFAARWKAVPAVLALFLFALFFVSSMPEKSNQRDWKNGWLGARVYGRTKIWMSADDRGEAALPDRLTGLWNAPRGFGFAISRDGIRMTSPDGEIEWSARTCRHRFQMDYDFAFRSNLEQRMPDGLAFTSFDQTPVTPLMALPDRRFPRLSCSCDSTLATWVLVDIDRMMVITDSGQVLLAGRS
jgi:hypothetical protein